jgi:phosphatidylserine/phosphatidylglycerophosphate/cardiolipin synthase-like enzyme
MGQNRFAWKAAVVDGNWTTIGSFNLNLMTLNECLKLNLLHLPAVI